MAGVILRIADGEHRLVVHQHPLYECGEVLTRTASWEACPGPFAEAGDVDEGQDSASGTSIPKTL